MTSMITAFGNAPWEQLFIKGLGHPMFGVNVAKRCVDGIDMLAAVRTMDIDAVIVSDDVMRVDEQCVADVLAAGVQLIALTANRQLWIERGVTDLVDLHEDEIPSMVTKFMQTLRDTSDGPIEETVAEGKLIAVLGFGGASGRSTCALEVAQEIAKSATTCLVDADMYAPSLAQQVGHTEFSGGILGLTRIAELRKLSELSLHESASTLESGVVFLRGIPSIHRWLDLRIHSLRSMWGYLKSLVAFTIVDCGPAYEVLDMHTEVTAKPTRGIAALTALDACDTVVLTANGTDLGITRLINGFSDIQDFISDKDLIVVVHGVADVKAEHEIRLLLANELGVTAIVCLRKSDMNYERVAELIKHEQPVQTKTARRGIIRRRAA